MSIKVENLTFGYHESTVLHDISFQAQQGEILSVLGANGVGKSTLFKCMLGLLKKYQGHIFLQGEDITILNTQQLASKIAYIPQANYTAFNYTVFDMVLMGTTSQVHFASAPGAPQKKTSGTNARAGGHQSPSTA